MTKYLLLLLLAAAPLARADEASHKAVATQFVDISEVPKAMRAAVMGFVNPMLERLVQQGMPAVAVDEMKQAITSWYDEEIKWQDLKPQMVELYTQEFTEPELKEMLAFYQSPTGRKALAVMPAIMQQMAKIQQAYFQGKQQSLNNKIAPVIDKYRDKKP